jgi:hypothetical protein
LDRLRNPDSIPDDHQPTVTLFEVDVFATIVVEVEPYLHSVVGATNVGNWQQAVDSVGRFTVRSRRPFRASSNEFDQAEECLVVELAVDQKRPVQVTLSLHLVGPTTRHDHLGVFRSETNPPGCLLSGICRRRYLQGQQATTTEPAVLHVWFEIDPEPRPSGGGLCAASESESGDKPGLLSPSVEPTAAPAPSRRASDPSPR